MSIELDAAKKKMVELLLKGMEQAGDDTLPVALIALTRDKGFVTLIEHSFPIGGLPSLQEWIDIYPGKDHKPPSFRIEVKG